MWAVVFVELRSRRACPAVSHREVNKNWVRNSKINEEQAKEIIKLRKTISTKEIAEKFNLNTGTINQIVSGRKWKHLER